MEPTVTWYTILGIEKDASPAEVKKAYKQRALVTHPDKLDPGASDELRQVAESQFHQVHLAYEVLSDPLRRKAYDYTLRTPAGLPPTLHARASSFFDEYQSKLAREREEWARKEEQKHRERMRTPITTSPATPSAGSQRPDVARGNSCAPATSMENRQASERAAPRTPSQDRAKPRYTRAGSSSTSTQTTADTARLSAPSSPPPPLRPSAPPSPDKNQSRPLPHPPPARSSTSATPSVTNPPTTPLRRHTHASSPASSTFATSPSPVLRSCAADAVSPATATRSPPTPLSRTSYCFTSSSPSANRLSFTASAPPLSTADTTRTADHPGGSTSVEWETLLGMSGSDAEGDELELDPAALAEKMLHQMRASHPEWEARRKEVLMRQRAQTQANIKAARS